MYSQQSFISNGPIIFLNTKINYKYLSRQNIKYLLGGHPGSMLAL